MLEDDKIVQGCRKNDRRAQQDLFLKYGKGMYGYCLRYTDNPDDANDLLQDGFMKVFDNISSYKGDNSLHSWMARIFINLAISNFRKRSAGPRFVEVEEADTFEANEENAEVEMHDLERVMQAVKELPEKYRLVLNMYAVDKLGHKEIATALGITEGTSKSQLSRARQMLKELLDKETKS